MKIVSCSSCRASAKLKYFCPLTGTFTNSGGHPKFSPVKLNSHLEISVHFLFKFELNVDRFGSRRGVHDGEVVSAIALVLNSPANL